MNDLTGEPISGASVIILGSTSGTTTNAAGYFELKEIQDSADLVISHIGYATGEVKVGEVRNMLIKLEAIVYELNKPFIPSKYLIDRTQDSTIEDLAIDEIFFVEDEEVDEVFRMVDANANYKGGWNQFYKELASNASLMEVIPDNYDFKVQFTITGNGKATNVKVSYDSAQEEMGTALSKLNGYIPAIQKGKNLSQTLSFEVYTAEEVFLIVEESAQFPGGIKGFYEYQKRELDYPKEAQRRGIQGNVIVQFTVETDGSITEIKLIKGIGGGCDEEAIRVIRNMPKWIPAKQRGKAVRQRMTQNIRFKFSDGPFINNQYSEKAEFPGAILNYLNF